MALDASRAERQGREGRDVIEGQHVLFYTYRHPSVGKHQHSTSYTPLLVTTVTTRHYTSLPSLYATTRHYTSLPSLHVTTRLTRPTASLHLLHVLLTLLGVGGWELFDLVLGVEGVEVLALWLL